jgi:hypothetical protein
MHTFFPLFLLQNPSNNHLNRRFLLHCLTAGRALAREQRWGHTRTPRTPLRGSAALRQFRAVASSFFIPAMGDNAAPTSTTAATNTRSTTGRPFTPLHFFTTANSSYSTCSTGSNPGAVSETELQPWSYRQRSHSAPDAVRRKDRELRELKASRASEVWTKFWT